MSKKTLTFGSAPAFRISLTKAPSEPRTARELTATSLKYVASWFCPAADPENFSNSAVASLNHVRIKSPAPPGAKIDFTIFTAPLKTLPKTSPHLAAISPALLKNV